MINLKINRSMINAKPGRKPFDFSDSHWASGNASAFLAECKIPGDDGNPLSESAIKRALESGLDCGEIVCIGEKRRGVGRKIPRAEILELARTGSNPDLVEEVANMREVDINTKSGGKANLATGSKARALLARMMNRDIES